jgi:hypothetical protein
VGRDVVCVATGVFDNLGLSDNCVRVELGNEARHGEPPVSWSSRERGNEAILCANSSLAANDGRFLDDYDDLVRGAPAAAHASVEGSTAPRLSP